ncbi:MAG: hypothetical protein JWO12_860 [Frankiales bacterium]|jgi:hypothetical protein|nr:hypothetical protein [Frankiales bacterium]
MSTSVPRQPNDDFVARHRSMDERLEEAFARYEAACLDLQPTALFRARLDLALLLWTGEELPPMAVRTQLVLDTEQLVEETPPLA